MDKAALRRAVRSAIENGHLHVLKLLLRQVKDPVSLEPAHPMWLAVDCGQERDRK